MGVRTRPDTRNLFAVTDSMDVATLASLFAEDAQVVFGNNRPLVGVDEIRTGKPHSLKRSRASEVVNTWNVGDDTIDELKVTYDRKDGQQVTIPCVSIFHTDATGKIDAYRVYFDVAPIYN
jgi:ketosteroid isomerase-like protein